MNVPPKLRSADIKRFAHRAAQVESLKPPIAYWCYYWIVQQILRDGLHNADDAAKTFTTKLMDKLEEMKSRFSTDEAITDDVAGQAYVEQFGFETFQRAENAMSANKATKQTADTFQASATFLELVNIWGPPNPEIASKIKFAKFHALRIAKAVNAGEDPNLTNPVSEPEPLADAAILDPSDPEVRQINGADEQQSVAEHTIQQEQGPQSHSDGLAPDSSTEKQVEHNTPKAPPMSPPAQYEQPSVADAPDEHDHIQRNLAMQSNVDESLHPSRAPSVPPPGQTVQSPEPPTTGLESGMGRSQSLKAAEASPPVHPPEATNRQASIGGGYFPSLAPPDAPSLSQENIGAPSGLISPADHVQSNSMNIAPDNAQAFYSGASHPPQPPESTFAPRGFPSHSAPSPNPRQQAIPTPPHQPQALQQGQQPPYQPPSIRQPPNTLPSSGPQAYLTDDNAVLAAQKHAKFAISALNFEDVPTAVKELREALKSLGAN